MHKDDIVEKLQYLGLNLEKIPMTLRKFEPLEFRIPKFYDEKQYKQYRYVEVKDIQILLSPTNRLDELEEKYKKSSPLACYLDSKKQENFEKYTTFLKMLKEVKIEDIEKVEKEQEKLSTKIPFKVKYEGNYLWQIYYSENTNKYFMLVPTEDSDYSTFFYLIKKKLEKTKNKKIFVPIRNVGYSNTYLRKTEYEDIENYLWLFTKDWPLIYEVYDANENLTVSIIGETNVYGKIKSPYRIDLKDEKEATQFYKLLKAMFILQTELPHYFLFKTNINRNGEIEFYIENRKIEYGNITKWINDEYKVCIDKMQEAEKIINENKGKLENLKLEASMQDLEYIEKEKQISTFLECKRTFFGKFKYFFKYSKKNKSSNIKNKVIKTQDIIDEEDEEEVIEETEEVVKKKKENYTIEELIEIYKQYETKENEIKDQIMDINALKLKNKNMKKKIENATLYIEEIDKHKKSIFEFWKYSNKDEVATLPEGEKEEVNIVKKVTKYFDYEEDLENFGKTMDEIERKALSKRETDSLYITTTNILEMLNKIKANDISPKEIDNDLKELKKEARKEKLLTEDNDFDIFGGKLSDNTKVSKINNKKHREMPKDKYNILDINKNTKPIGYKITLEQLVENIKTSLEKVQIVEDLPVYKATNGMINNNNINLFNINPENEMLEAIKTYENTITFNKINLKKGTNAISYTNIIFYDNQNKTLPIGQDLSTQILVDTQKLKLMLPQLTNFNIVKFVDEKDDFSDIIIKTVKVLEYDIEEE